MSNATTAQETTTMTRYYGTAVSTQPGAPREGQSDLRPARISLKNAEWCDEAGCPAAKCVHCKSMKEPTMPRFIVVSPQEMQHRSEVGTYAERFGWVVKDTQAPATTGQVFWSGGEREMRRAARELNRRELNRREG